MERRCAGARNSSNYKEVARSKTGGCLLMLSQAMGHAAIPAADACKACMTLRMSMRVRSTAAEAYNTRSQITAARKDARKARRDRRTPLNDWREAL